MRNKGGYINKQRWIHKQTKVVHSEKQNIRWKDDKTTTTKHGKQ